MDTTFTTLPIAPDLFWGGAFALLLVALTTLIWFALSQFGRPYRRPVWEDLPEGWRWLVILVGLLWIGLFLMTIAATYRGVWQLLSPIPDTGQTSLGLGALIATMLGGPLVIWTTIIKQRALGFQKEGHITDRISKAVEQLGAEKTIKRPLLDEEGKPRLDPEGKPIVAEQTVPNIEVRIGGILSLERIAQDSTLYDNGRDHVRVMEILCAYIRENARTSNLEPTPVPFVTKRPRIDIQTTIDVIKRRLPSQISIETNLRYRLNLREVDLDGCDLSNGSFVGAIFWRSRFESADLKSCDLTGAQMQSCLLNYSNFRDSTLSGTILDWSRLDAEGGLMSGISLAKFKGVFIEAARFEGLRITPKNAKGIFGSKDTKLSLAQTDLQSRGLAIADENFMNELTDKHERADRPERDTGNDVMMFAHWNPYTRNDLAAGELRLRFRKEWGLVGWPFED